MKVDTKRGITNFLTEFHIVLALFVGLAVSLVCADYGRAFTATPLAGLELEQIITIPNWANTGSKQASTDVFSFDPATHTMYFADRVNKGVSVIDTNTNTYLGTIVVPGCNGTGSCPSGVLVARELHKLVATDRNITGTDLNHIYIYDLRLPGPPIMLTLPAGLDTDELDYDPLNHRAYVANTKAPYFLTVVDLVTNAIVDQIPLPGNPEQPRFNPVDGFIYQTIPDDDPTTGKNNSVVLRIDPTKSGNNGTSTAPIVAIFPTPGCADRGIDVDPLTNTAVVGCAGSDPQVLMDLSNGNILATFPQVTGTDTEYFNSNVRRWYTASSNNTNGGVSCPQDSTGAFPVVGVFTAPNRRNQIATVVGADCSGRNGHGIGVDPFENDLYVGVRQFPADPASAATGQPGVLVFHDPVSPAQEPRDIQEAHADLKPLAGFHEAADVHFEDGRVSATVAGLPAGADALLNVTTTIGNEVVNCSANDGTCNGLLLGEPLIGGVVFLSADGTPAAEGRIGLGHGGGGKKH